MEQLLPPRSSQAGRDRQVWSTPSCVLRGGGRLLGEWRGEAGGADHRADVCAPQDGHTQYCRKGCSVLQSFIH